MVVGMSINGKDSLVMQDNNLVSDELLKLSEKIEAEIKDVFSDIEKVQEKNERKVLQAFIKHRISEGHLMESSGYGYNDRGRDALDAVYADVFGAEDALVRPHFVSGTHALVVALFAILRPGDKLLAVTGKPYDTLEEAIGISGENNGSLKDFGIIYEQLELTKNGMPDFEAIEKSAPTAKVVYIQRSRGYSLRPSLLVSTIADIADRVHRVNPEAIVMVDNCYGEFVDVLEPTAIGADLMAGSLIKNPGGGLAKSGGYIAGKRKLVEQAAYRLTCPGMGKEVGASLGQNRSMYMGFFMAPSVVANSLKVSSFALRLFERLGFEGYPKVGEKRSDIITALKLGSADALIAFCEGIQSGSPIDSFVKPEPWEMPGYQSKVIMAAGAFTSGASIELSADAPLQEPFAVWLQGGLTYYTGKAGVLLAAQTLLDRGFANITS